MTDLARDSACGVRDAIAGLMRLSVLMAGLALDSSGNIGFRYLRSMARDAGIGSVCYN